MFPTICRCCGGKISGFVPPNYNLCPSCALEEDDQTEPSHLKERSVAEASHSSEEFLTPEGPTVFECLEALEEAEHAIAEVAAQQPIAAPRRTRVLS